MLNANNERIFEVDTVPVRTHFYSKVRYLTLFNTLGTVTLVATGPLR